MKSVTAELSQEILQASLALYTAEELIEFLEEQSLKFRKIEEYQNISIAFDTTAYIARLKRPDITEVSTKRFLFELKEALTEKIFNMNADGDIKRGWAIAIAVILEMQIRENCK